MGYEEAKARGATSELSRDYNQERIAGITKYFDPSDKNKNKGRQSRDRSNTSQDRPNTARDRSNTAIADDQIFRTESTMDFFILPLL